MKKRNNFIFLTSTNEISPSGNEKQVLQALVLPALSDPQQTLLSELNSSILPEFIIPSIHPKLHSLSGQNIPLGNQINKINISKIPSILPEWDSKGMVLIDKEQFSLEKMRTSWDEMRINPTYDSSVHNLPG